MNAEALGAHNGGMRLAVCQLAPDYAAPIDDRRADAAALVKAQAGADLVMLPELWPQGGFLYRRWAEQAEPLDGPTFEAIAESARSIGAHVHAGSVVERDAEGRLYNTSMLLGPDGDLLATYRKIHLFGFSQGEPELMTAGTEVVVADTRLGRLGLATCYDLRFPELFRALRDRGAELILLPAAWPAARIEHWSVLARARAIEDQIVVVAGNTGGDQEGKALGGHSAVIDAQGAVLVEAAHAAADVLTAEVDLDGVHAWRERFPVDADRRLG
ncbi:MAG: nitrilase-related carbon-nitrogen hydrolase [Candidatus Nanopelagicales bacterium]